MRGVSLSPSSIVADIAVAFAGIPCKDIPVPSWDGSPFDGVDLPHEVLIRPVKDSRSVSMLFPIPWGSTEVCPAR